MPSTITALFDSRADAEAAKDRLTSLRVGAEHIQIHDQASPGYSDSSYSTHQDRGIWESIKHAFLPDEDRHTYEEGVRRGGVLLTADVEEDRVDEAARALDDANSVDIEERSSQWRTAGWQYPASGDALGFGAAGGEAFGESALGAAGTGTLGEPGLAATSGTALGQDGFGESSRSSLGEGSLGTSDSETLRETDRDRTLASGHEDVVPIVQEQLVVGKRDVDRGSVRVRSYVTETPVHEQIRLRDEQVNVERRAVDRPLTGATEDAFRERTIDVTATGEEAVVSKTARVVEEVVVSKTAQEHDEQIDDTVRHTDVEIDRDAEDAVRRAQIGTTTNQDI